MASAKKSKHWQLACLLGIFCTDKVATVVRDNLPGIQSTTTAHSIAELIVNAVDHPHEMFPSHSIFSLTKKNFNALKELTAGAARAYMRENKFFVAKQLPRLRLKNKANTTLSKRWLMEKLRKMTIRSARTFGKKNIWRVFTRFRNKALVQDGKKSFRAMKDWNSFMLTGPGSRRLLNAYSGDPRKFADSNESAAAFLHFSQYQAETRPMYVAHVSRPMWPMRRA